jgi:hypothetical protein
MPRGYKEGNSATHFTCAKCNELNERWQSSGTYCRTCYGAYRRGLMKTPEARERKRIEQARNRFALKKGMVDRLGGKCIYCGFNKYQSALDFHHVGEKTHEIGRLFNDAAGAPNGKARRLLEEEVKKCVLVCSNCHKGLHSGELIP